MVEVGLSDLVKVLIFLSKGWSVGLCRSHYALNTIGVWFQVVSGRW